MSDSNQSKSQTIKITAAKTIEQILNNESPLPQKDDEVWKVMMKESKNDIKNIIFQRIKKPYHQLSILDRLSLVTCWLIEEKVIGDDTDLNNNQLDEIIKYLIDGTQQNSDKVFKCNCYYILGDICKSFKRGESLITVEMLKNNLTNIPIGGLQDKNTFVQFSAMYLLSCMLDLLENDDLHNYFDPIINILYSWNRIEEVDIISILVSTTANDDNDDHLLKEMILKKALKETSTKTLFTFYRSIPDRFNQQEQLILFVERFLEFDDSYQDRDTKIIFDVIQNHLPTTIWESKQRSMNNLIDYQFRFIRNTFDQNSADKDYYCVVSKNIAKLTMYSNLIFETLSTLIQSKDEKDRWTILKLISVVFGYSPSSYMAKPNSFIVTISEFANDPNDRVRQAFLDFLLIFQKSYGNNIKEWGPLFKDSDKDTIISKLQLIIDLDDLSLETQTKMSSYVFSLFESKKTFTFYHWIWQLFLKIWNSPITHTDEFKCKIISNIFSISEFFSKQLISSYIYKLILVIYQPTPNNNNNNNNYNYNHHFNIMFIRKSKIITNHSKDHITLYTPYLIRNIDQYITHILDGDQNDIANGDLEDINTALRHWIEAPLTKSEMITMLNYVPLLSKIALRIDSMPTLKQKTSELIDIILTILQSADHIDKYHQILQDFIQSQTQRISTHHNYNLKVSLINTRKIVRLFGRNTMTIDQISMILEWYQTLLEDHPWDNESLRVQLLVSLIFNQIQSIPLIFSTIVPTIFKVAKGSRSEPISTLMNIIGSIKDEKVLAEIVYPQVFPSFIELYLSTQGDNYLLHFCKLISTFLKSIFVVGGGGGGDGYSEQLLQQLTFVLMYFKPQVTNKLLLRLSKTQLNPSEPQEVASIKVVKRILMQQLMYIPQNQICYVMAKEDMEQIFDNISHPLPFPDTLDNLNAIEIIIDNHHSRLSKDNFNNIYTILTTNHDYYSTTIKCDELVDKIKKKILSFINNG